MADTIHTITSLDVYRDGGSLSMSFLDGEGNTNELVFKVGSFENELPDTYRTYRHALLAKFSKTIYVSPVTGISMPKTDLIETEISWPDAKEILAEAKPLILGFESDYLWVFDSMLSVVNDSQHRIRYS